MYVHSLSDSFCLVSMTTEWWHGVYICQLVVEIILLVITAGLWIGFGATIGNIRSMSLV